MGSFNVNPTTILSKIHVRTPSQAESLSSRYVFLNLNNAEPNLGKPPGIYGGTYYSTLTSDEYLGIRYALLSNNHSGSAWRVWAYDNPRIAAYSKEGSLGIGDNAYPLNIKSFVYSNYAFDNQNNRYNSQSFSNKTFNVFALSGIYLFDSTTIGDPASAIAFIVTDEGNVGIGVEDPAERLTVNGNISSNGSLFVRDLSANNLTISGNISASGSLTINGNTTLGDSNLDTLTLNGTSVSIPNNLNFDTDTLFIDAANNRVGIGTDTPDQKLHVLKASAGTVTADTNSIAVFEGNGSNHITILTPDAQTGGVVFGSPGDIIGSYLTWNYGNNALKLATASNNGFIQLLTNNEAEAVRITSGGSVGIGTTVPAEKLTVLGNISASGSTRTALLSVVRNTAGADAAIQIIAGNASGDAASIFFGHADSQSRGQIRYYNGGTDALTFSCATSEAMRIRANGNVGIGTTVPGEKLTVNGAISASGGISLGRTTKLPGISAATLMHATTALTLSITDIFLKINISGTDYALPLYNYTT